ncbi:MAG TPA: copper chaperone PCu(A)C [Anaerolineaceae bacterium]|nr:copper chaperone PCu(A)C [Anaerolineaceae bacterium]
MNIKKSSILAIVMLLVLILSACSAVQAGTGASVKAEGVWARPSRASGNEMMGTVAGAFMVLKNDGSQADRLISASSDVAKVVEIHETVMEGEVAKMQKLSDGLEIPAGGSVELKPGSYHVMLINLQQDLVVGDKFALELQFEKSGAVSVEVEVKEAAASMQ